MARRKAVDKSTVKMLSHMLDWGRIEILSEERSSQLGILGVLGPREGLHFEDGIGMTFTPDRKNTELGMCKHSVWRPFSQDNSQAFTLQIVLTQLYGIVWSDHLAHPEDGS